MRYAGIALVYAWRYTLGLLTPPGTCKYHPSCSQYAIDALREHGFFRGAVLAGWRILRCNPWSHGGVDHARDQTLFPLRRRQSRRLRSLAPPSSLRRVPLFRSRRVKT